MSAPELVVVGRVGKSHGLDGSFVVERASETRELFAVGAKLFVEGAEATVVGSRQARGRPVIRLDRRVPRSRRPARTSTTSSSSSGCAPRRRAGGRWGR